MQKRRNKKRLQLFFFIRAELTMGRCFPCLSLGGKKMEEEEETEIPATAGDPRRRIVAARAFTFAELAAATWDFADDGLVGPGVYTGYLECVNQVVAIKQILLDRHGVEQGNREFLTQVLMLSMTRHPNIINLIGYCADGNHRILIFEYMPLGSLEDRLYDRSPDKARLDWNTRMKIAAGVARGLEHLHDNSSHPVIYRGMRCSDILLGEGYHPKLSEFGLAKLGPVGDDTHVSTAVMGAPGYLDPEYAMTGHLTVKSDVYSFGVVLLEIITGRRAVDDTRGEGEEHIAAWAAPLLKHKRNFGGMADPALEGEYPSRGLAQSLAVAAMCVQRHPSARPAIRDVVAALDYLASSQTYHPDQKHGSYASDRNQKLG